jgi:hypothetical protein
MPSSIDQETRALDETLKNLIGHIWPMDYLLPTNMDEEKDTFFAALSEKQAYNPQFEYPSPPEDVQNILESLRGLAVPEGPFAFLYRSCIGRYKLYFQMIADRTALSFTQKAIELFGVPSASLIQEAHQWVKKIKPVRHGDAYSGIRVVIERIRERLTAERIEGWSVGEGSSHIWLMDTHPLQKKILVPAGLLVNEHLIEKIIQRAVEVDTYRAKNAARQSLHVFRHGTMGWEEARAALTLELERRQGRLQLYFLRNAAGGLLASYYASTHSFYETFRYLRTLFTDDKAYSLTQKVKMGLHDTSEKGGLLAEHLSLQGMKKLQNQSMQALHALYVGQVAIAHVEPLMSLLQNQAIADPAFIPLLLQGRH